MKLDFNISLVKNYDLNILVVDHSIRSRLLPFISVLIQEKTTVLINSQYYIESSPKDTPKISSIYLKEIHRF